MNMKKKKRIPESLTLSSQDRYSRWCSCSLAQLLRAKSLEVNMTTQQHDTLHTAPSLAELHHGLQKVTQPHPKNLLVISFNFLAFFQRHTHSQHTCTKKTMVFIIHECQMRMLTMVHILSKIYLKNPVSLPALFSRSLYPRQVLYQ